MDLMTGFTSPSRIALTLLAVLSLAGSAAAATEVPLKGGLEGTVTRSSDPGNPAIVQVDVEGEGHASQLGRFTFSAPHYVDTVARTATGTYELTAANGDTVTADFTGTATPTDTPGVLLIVETATVTGGTGRFAGATGSFTVERLYDPRPARPAARSTARSPRPAIPGSETTAVR